MFYSLLLIAFGVFLGQEYPTLPSVKHVFNNFVQFLDNRKNNGVVYRGEFEFTDLNNEDSSSDSNSDTDSDVTLTLTEVTPPKNNTSEKEKYCNLQ